MAKAILDARIYLAECDLSGTANAAALNLKTDVVECTAFSDAYKDKLAGMTDVICDVSGFFSAEATTGNPDTKMFTQLGLSNALLTMATGAGAFGETAYFFRPVLTQYTPLEGKVGDVAAFKLHGEGTGELIKGSILIPKTALVLTGAGAGLELGALSAAETIYCGLHIFEVSGTLPTLDLLLESDVDDNWSSATTQITFAEKSAVGFDWQTKAGAVADTYWRLSYTIGGTLPSFTIAVVAGIL